MPAIAAFHVEQTEANGCVAACIAMVKRAMGQPFTEDDHARIMKLGDTHGVPVGVAARELGGTGKVVGPDELLAQAPLWLADGRLLVMLLCGPPYVSRRGTRPGGRPSRHGDLCAPGERGRPYHVVLVIAWTEEGCRYLDPYYPVEGQPLQMTDDEVVAAFAGQLVVTPPVPEFGT